MAVLRIRRYAQGRPLLIAIAICDTVRSAMRTAETLGLVTAIPGTPGVAPVRWRATDAGARFVADGDPAVGAAT